MMTTIRSVCFSSLGKNLTFSRIHHCHKLFRNHFTAIHQNLKLCNYRTYSTEEQNQDKSTNEPVDPTLGFTIISFLRNLNKSVVLDLTFGDGNHTCSILNHFPNVRVIALDRDVHSYNLAIKLRDQSYKQRLLPLHGKISDLPSLLQRNDSKCFLMGEIDAVLLDPGVSDIQLNDVNRGFDYAQEAPLDMRMDKDGEVSVFEVLRHIQEYDLRKILKYYGGELQYNKISTTLIEERCLMKRISKTTDISDVIEKLFGKSYSPACVFQALRMFVNNELNELHYGLKLAHHYLKSDGKLITISHNPQEDGVIANHLTGKNVVSKKDKFGDAKDADSAIESYSMEELKNYIPNKWRDFAKSPIIPSLDEQKLNPALRTVRIRVAQKNFNS